GYNNPSESKFRIFTELTDSPFDGEITFLKIGVKGREIDRRDRRPINLTLVVDVSGSMNRGGRLNLVRRSINMLIDQLDRRDQVGIVAYNTRAHVVTDPVSARHKRELQRAVGRLMAGGSTNAEAGLTLGYQMANRQYVSGHNNLVVLISDGVANVGQTGADGIMGRIERFARKGITLTSFGVGMGNYNDVLLEQLAQKGNGRYAYINDMAEARRAMVDNFIANTLVLGRDFKVQVEFNPKMVHAYRLIGYENREVADYRFRDNSQDGGEVGAGHEVTALYELKIKGPRHGKVADVSVRWINFEETEVVEVAREARLRESFVPFDRARAELRLAVVASRFAEKLKRTPFSQYTSYDHLAQLAEEIEHDWSNDQTRELRDLIRRARDLSYNHSDWFEYDDQPVYQHGRLRERQVRQVSSAGNYKR
ncbi:DUF3520 domain-containing protein, partial [candidate division GN15 bacterium]|nr:DUF3520 domain-containing protein [candidate division GN15 bacterium]